MGYFIAFKNFALLGSLFLYAATLTAAVQRYSEPKAIPAIKAPHLVLYDSNGETSKLDSFSNIFRRQNYDCRSEFLSQVNELQYLKDVSPHRR